MPADIKNAPQKGKSVLGIFADYTVLDLETTGLSPAADDIIEFGIVKVSNHKVVDSFQAFVNPGYPISAFISNLTGITNSMLKGEKKIEEILPAALSFIGDSLVIAHNSHFDLGFIRHGSAKYLKQPFLNNSLDTVRMSRRLYPAEKHHRLGDLISRFGVKQSSAHRALSDAEATQKCYEIMCRHSENGNIVF